MQAININRNWKGSVTAYEKHFAYSHSPLGISRGHLCLLVEEILQPIFSDLPRRDLAAAALVCQAWLDPALDALWGEVELPALLNVLSLTCVTNQQLQFTHRLSEKSWARFHNLAPRIRTLSNHKDILSSELIDELYLTNPKPLPLLPNIRILRWYVEPTPPVGFLGFELRQLHITIFGHTSVFFTCVASSLGRNLTNIRINLLYNHPATQQDVEALAEMLRLLHGLRTADVRMEDIDLGPVLVALSELPVLEVVVMTCLSILVPTMPMSLNKPFPFIRRLELKAQQLISGTSALLNCMADDTASGLTDIVLGDVRDGCRLGVVEEVTWSLGRHQDLCSIVINADCDPSSITGTLLGPISRCHGLEILKVYVDGSLAITDEELESVLSGLSKLREIALWGNAEAPTTFTTLTVHSFGVVATLCPSIEEIYFSLPELSGRILQHSFQPSSTLHTISVGISAIEDARSMAIFLERLSDVETLCIKSSWDVGTEQDDLWNEVAALVPALKRAKKQERETTQGLSSV
ncbi:hypothetical protein FRB96_004472 [Tulasnella sp. 330]|nr:hypothetical protein FRB96_004472 [Tulasnella sp. 330]